MTALWCDIEDLHQGDYVRVGPNLIELVTKTDISSEQSVLEGRVVVVVQRGEQYAVLPRTGGEADVVSLDTYRTESD